MRDCRTVSLLIATLAFNGAQLEEAKLGVLSAAVVASGATWLVFRVTDRLPRRMRLRALLGGDRRRSSISRCRSIRSATTSAARAKRR